MAASSRITELGGTNRATNCEGGQQGGQTPVKKHCTPPANKRTSISGTTTSGIRDLRVEWISGKDNIAVC